MSLDVERLRKYVALWKRCERLERELKESVHALANLGVVCADSLVDEGVLGFPVEVDGEPFHLYMHTSLSVRSQPGVTAEERIAALREAELDWMIEPSYSPSRLTAWVKEQLGEHEEQIPFALSSAFDINVEDELRVRGGTQKKSLAAKAASFYRNSARREARARTQEPKDPKTQES